jgi:diguanylate cyclase (GGDEF)-like protein
MARIRAWLADLPIQKKLLLFNLMTACVSGLFAGALLVVIVWRAELSGARQEAQVKAAIIAENALPALQFGDAATAEEILGGLRRDRQVIEARIVKADGQVFARFATERGGRLSSAPFRIDPIDTSVPLLAGDELLATLHLRYDMEEVVNEVMLYVGAVMMATLVALLVGSYVVVRLQRTITSPLAQLTELMREFSQGENFSRRAAVPNRDELGQLSASFNQMIEKIETRTVALNHELAERRRAEKQLEHLAHHDQVTGLPNRHYFRRRTTDLMRGRALDGNTMALLFVDLDNFKYVNDTFGHDLGDQLLIAIARRLSDGLRAHDMVVRFGGDEFVVLLDRIGDATHALRLAQKLLDTVTVPMHLADHNFSVTCSIGVALAPQQASDFDELLKKADAAMYAAKNAGKNSFRLWEPSMSESTSSRFAIEADLRQAIELHEFEMHYQPVLEIATGRVVGMEALMRWRHPIRGYVSPSEFIPVAEDTGLILQLGDWGMRTAFSQCAAWNARFGPLFVAVNVSARQFREQGFAEKVDAIATASGLDRSLCEIEITESMIMGHTGEAVRLLQDLSNHGFTLSIDDFGTGYSSMAYLKRFPVDKLKIDRSFVRDLPHDVEDAAICEAIIGLTRSLRIHAVAEGVETAAQVALLKRLGCGYGQGFHFSKPLPVEQMTSFLAQPPVADLNRAAAAPPDRSA